LKQLRFTVNCLPLGHHQPAQPPLRGSRMVASRYVLCPLYSYWRLLLSIISVSLVQRRRIQYIHCFLRQLRDRHGLYLTFGLRRVIRAYLIWPSCRRGGYHIGNSPVLLCWLQKLSYRQRVPFPALVLCVLFYTLTVVLPYRFRIEKPEVFNPSFPYDHSVVLIIFAKSRKPRH